MSTDSKQIPTVTLSTLFENDGASYAKLKKDGTHTLYSVNTDETGTSTPVIGTTENGLIVIKHQTTTIEVPFVYRQTVSGYTQYGDVAKNLHVEKTPELQQYPVVGVVQSTRGTITSLSYQLPVMVNEDDACTTQPLQAVAEPIRIAILETNTGKTLGHLTYPPVEPGKIAIGKGHRVVEQENTTFTIDALVTAPASALNDNSSDALQASSLITVNVMDESLLSGNRTLLDQPQLLLRNFGGVTQIAVLPREDGNWDLAVMGYAEGNVQSQILVVKDILSQKGIIDAASLDNLDVSIINFQKHPYDDSNPGNRIVQVRLNGRRYLALATQNQFYCDQDRPLWLIDLKELEKTAAPLTLGNETADVTQIALFSNDAGDCFGLHALNVVNNGTESLTVSSIENFDNEGPVDRIYVVKTLPDSIVEGTVNQIAVQDTAAFIIANNRDSDGHIECSSMSLTLKGSNQFISTDNSLLASRCASGGANKRVLIIDFAAAEELALANVTDTNMDDFDSDSTGMTDDSDSIGIAEIVAQKEQKNTWFSAGLGGLASFSSSAALVAQGLLGATASPAKIGPDSPVHTINCYEPPKEPSEFPVALACGLGAAALLAAGSLTFFVVNKCKGESSAQNSDVENGQPAGESSRLINNR